MPPVDAIATAFAQQKIIEACKLYYGIGLNETKQPAVWMPCEGIGVQTHTYAVRDNGDSPCVWRGGGSISRQHCLEVFNYIIISCHHNVVDIKTYGGAKIDGYNVYGFDVPRIFGIGLGNARG